MIKTMLAVVVTAGCLMTTAVGHGAIVDLWTFENTLYTTPTTQNASDTLIPTSGASRITPGSDGLPGGHAMQANTGFSLLVDATSWSGPFTITYDGESGAVGSVSQQWSYSVNSGSSWTVLGTQPSALATGSYSPFTVTFSDVGLNNNAGVRFKDDLTGGAGNFDNIQISAVPEPINVALVVFGVCVAGAGAGRRVYAWVRA